jgi:hypothetical protein
MNLSTSFSSKLNLNSRLPANNLALIPVRVIDVIMDETHPEYDKYGKTKCIGAIKYQPVDKKLNSDNTETLPIAFPSSATLRTIPLINEIVLLTSAPDDISSNEKSTSSTFYYISIISVWNHPHHNASPDGATTSKVELGNDFKEKSNINPLQPYPGDVLVEGRQGQSIRLSGNKHFKNIYTNQSNEGDPFTIISNGQKKTENGSEYIEEDINEDESSIYLVSNHTVPLEQARDKTKAWKKAPIKADGYEGSQVVVNGGRLYFNSKEESTLFSSKEAFGVTSKTINLDAKDYIALDAEKIYLGEKALVEEFEPVILGESMEGFLYTLLFNLQALADDLIIAGTAGVNVQNLITRGKLMQASLKGLQNQINPGGKSQLKSRKVYTE